MFDIIESYFIRVVKDTVDADKDGQITADDVLILGAQAALKVIPKVQKTLEDYLVEKGVKPEPIQFPI